MNYIYHISSIATTFGPLSKVTILGQKCMAILGIRHKKAWLPSAKLKPTFTFLGRDFAIFNTFTWQNPYQEK